MKVNKKDYSTIWLEKNKVKIIDQTKLPFKFVIKELSSLKSFFNAIKKNHSSTLREEDFKLNSKNSLNLVSDFVVNY